MRTAWLSHRRVGVERWDFNRASCYATASTAWATVPAAADRLYHLFAYWLLPFAVIEGGERQLANLDALFDARLPPLPEGGEPRDFEPLGFDVAEVSPYLGCFGHSPLSCNGLAMEVRVNRYCLVDTEAEAIALVEKCNREQPEPGDYYVIRIDRERSR
ncbi:MAG: hypothetical protein ACYDCL_01905 [Myxococcales bacterium]